MELLKYQRLTVLLDSLTDGADTLRAVFEKSPFIVWEPKIEYNDGKPARIEHFRKRRIPTREAREHPDFHHRHLMLNDADQVVTESARLMDKCGDEIESDSKARHNQGMTATDEIRALYGSMSRFLDATDTPIDGAGMLYDKTRNRCRALVNKLVTWFPDLNPNPNPNQADPHPAIPGNPAFVNRLVNSEAYKKAINNGDITPPNIWNGTIKDLSIWLESNGLLTRPKPYNMTDKITRWKLADGVFLKDGKLIGSDQLKGGFSH